ncbi:MAG: hypothetical protein ACQES5_03105 [Thermodesulfobacteriota bacterium]
MDNNFLAAQRKKTNAWKIFFFAFLCFILMLNIFFRVHHPHFELEKIPGFWAAFGFAGAIILGLISKAIAHRFLERSEDFYDRN